MNFNEYQNLAEKTAVYPEDDAIYYLSLGLAGEVGELCNKIKKVIRDDGGELSREKAGELADEAGDCLWYLSQLVRVIGFNFDTIAEYNIYKLSDRKEREVIKGSGDNR
jgi:NTP pyrophosphatase (non-canonical NTP hydrolase)